MSDMQLVVFELDGNEYAIDALSVNGILRAKKFEIKTIPGLPDYITGAIQLRGNVNYIFNLKKKLNIKNQDIVLESKFIMINIEDQVVGWIVDEVTDIIKFSTENIEMPPGFVKNERISYLKGIGKIDDRIIVLLNPENILNVEGLMDIDEVAAVLEDTKEALN
jgi:purine-binding chemotaxis protein CheW